MKNEEIIENTEFENETTSIEEITDAEVEEVGEFIYFDENKQAYAQKIDNYLCKISPDLWKEFCTKTIGKEYDIIGGEFVDLRQTEPYIQKQFEKAKAEKFTENDKKAAMALNHTFVINVGELKTACEFIYNEKTERNLNSSAIGFLAGQYETKQWTDEQGITVDLTAEDVAAVLLTFNDFANAIWEKWGEFYKQIETAQTLEELEAFEINYANSNL